MYPISTFPGAFAKLLVTWLLATVKMHVMLSVATTEGPVKFAKKSEMDTDGEVTVRLHSFLSLLSDN